MNTEELTTTLSDLDNAELREIMKQTHQVVDQHTLSLKWKAILDNSGQWGSTQHALNFSSTQLTPARSPAQQRNPLYERLSPAIAVSEQKTEDRHKNWARQITLLLATECDHMLATQQQEDIIFLNTPIGYHPPQTTYQQQPQKIITTPTKYKNGLQTLMKAGDNIPTFPSNYKIGETL